MKDRLTLRHCNFCGRAMTLFGDHITGFAADCEGCGARGPTKKDPVSAAQAWNRWYRHSMIQESEVETDG